MRTLYLPIRIFTVAIGLAFLVNSTTACAQERPRKKLIEFGWDRPNPEFVRQNIRTMEKRPFDGIIFVLKDFDHALDTRPWTEDGLQPQMTALSGIEWDKFTDNFLLLYSANQWKMDWFDDSQWEIICSNMALFSKAVAAGNCVGVCFDNEPYGDDPWVFTDRFPGRSWDEVAAQVRKRGAQFIVALRRYKPDLKVLHFFQLGYYGDTSKETHLYRKPERHDLLNEPDEAVRRDELAGRWLALFYPFFLGMLDSAGPGVVFIDGNEFSYYNDSPCDFYRDYHRIRQSALAMTPENLRPRYVTQAQAGMAVFYDILTSDTWEKTRPLHLPAHYMSQAEHLMFLEHNVYYALATTDEYVWFYSQQIDWWLDPVTVGKRAIPTGVSEALVNARTKIDRGEPLGFDIGEIIARVWQQAEKDYAEDKH